MKTGTIIGCLAIITFLVFGLAAFIGLILGIMQGPPESMPPEPVPPVISNVQVTAISPYELRFSWDTDMPANGQIMVCGKIDGVDDLCVWHDLPKLRLHQEILVDDFTPGERYKVTICATCGGVQGIFEMSDISTEIDR